MPRVIILNGISSSGKSSLAKAIQRHSASTVLHVEMDAFISFLPDGHELRPEWFRLDEIEVKKRKVPRITNGERGTKLLKAMRNFVVEGARSGFDLVVDEVCEAPDMAEYRRALDGYDLRVIKVFAPLELIESRERDRGDRLIGLARGQAEYLHRGIAYDHEIDTGSAGPDELARKLLDRLHGQLDYS